MAVLGEPIVGTERIVYDDSTGPGALPARPLISPKSMTALQRAIHDLTHLPYHPGCEVCVSCRRPNTMHLSQKAWDRDIPLMVADYCFPKHSNESDTLTVLILRIYPYKLFLCCHVAAKGRDPVVVHRVARFIKECGLTQFTYRADREPAIMAMIEEACALTGRKGTKDTSAGSAEEISHYDMVNDGDQGAQLAEELRIPDEPHVHGSQEVQATHTAAPEVTHPGESQSNGLAERSVGMFEDQFRTLKYALEIKIKRRLPSAHPVTAWLVEHTAWILNKFHLDKDGRTAYGRLHGREGREQICEFGERVMWFVPRKLRAKLDQRWRYGIFLGRSLSSDQNFIGLHNGEVVCARAIVRVVPGIRWAPDRISNISTSPLTFKHGSMDRIEEDPEPQAHPDPNVDSGSTARQGRRLRVLDSDVLKYGYTDSCQRCEYLRQNKAILARGTRHNEECRERLYDAMRADGTEKLQRADLENASRTQTRARKPQDSAAPAVNESMDVQTHLDDAPTTLMGDDVVDTTPHVNEPTMIDDTSQFFEDVNDALDVDWQGEELEDPEGDHLMSSMVDVLQTLGISASDAVAYSVDMVKNRPLRPVQYGHPYNPTMMEVYGKGNIVAASHGPRRNLNIDGLRAFDLRTVKPDGEAWNFSKPADRRLAKRIIEEEKPTWLIGSPPCTFYSAWNQGINHKRMSPERVESLRLEAVQHLHFVIGLYKAQVDNGRHFLHEHPATATSWSDPWMVRLLEHPKIATVTSDQCEYGLLTPDAEGTPTPAKKPTRWMSSSAHMLKRLSRRCSGQHVHQHLVGGRAKAAENYSVELITEIIRGIRDTADFEEEWGDALEPDLDKAMLCAGLLHDAKYSSLAAAYRAQDAKEEIANMKVRCKHRSGKIETTNLTFKQSYKDEYTNEELPIGDVRTAMLDELEYFCDKVWELVPTEQAMRDPDGKIIGSRWVNCNKNDINNPDVRCRLVAQEINLFQDESFFAATPPLEAKRMLFSEFATHTAKGEEPLQLSFVDVKKAYFYGVPDRTLYVRLPPELNMGKGMVGRLVRCMYGTRDAGAIWENCYTSCLLGMGFVQGSASPCCFRHEEWSVSVVVHGDDFTALGTSNSLSKFEAGMQKSFECKLKGRLGFGSQDLKEMRVLNRILRVTDDALLYEADPRHAEMMIKSFGLEESKSVVTPGVKVAPNEEDAATIDSEVDVEVELNRIIAELSPKKRSGLIRFSDHVEQHEVPAYSSIYGRHPKLFNFNRHGSMVKFEQGQKSHVGAGTRCSSSPNARRAILDRVLRDGAAWETPTTELIAKVSKAGKRKFAKARLGSKAAKKAERMETTENELTGDAATVYRALSARILYLSMDRPECSFAAKELCRHFAHPTQTGVEALKRAARFLLGMPRLVWMFPRQSRSTSLKVYVDTDFGGCQTTRRSTSGGIAMSGQHPIKHWSLTQTTIALSSGEAELSGICRGASIALGLQSIAKDLGINLQLEILTDATAAIGICRRRGLGKIRHLHTADLWVQDRLKTGDFTLTKVPGSDNPADILTKHVTKDVMMKHMKNMGLRAEEGRAKSAPTLQHS